MQTQDKDFQECGAQFRAETCIVQGGVRAITEVMLDGVEPGLRLCPMVGRDRCPGSSHAQGRVRLAHLVGISFTHVLNKAGLIGKEITRMAFEQADNIFGIGDKPGMMDG